MASAVIVVMLIATPLWALQPVTIVNPKHVPVSERQVNLLFHTTCRVVADEFHVKDMDTLDFPLTLVLGERDEHYTADEDKGVYTIYLNRWNEGKFATSAMRLAVWRMVPRKRRDQMVQEILRWADTIVPVPEH